MSAEDELFSIFESNAPDVIKCQALKLVLGLTGSGEGIDQLIDNKKCLTIIGSFLKEEKEAQNKELREISLKCFVNLSSENLFIDKMLEIDRTFIGDLIRLCFNEPSLAYVALMVIANVTHSEKASRQFIEDLKLRNDSGFASFLELMNCGKPASSYHLIGSILSNLTQLAETRNLLMNEKDLLIKSLLPYTTYEESEIRRLGIVGAIRNCCFNSEYHGLLLSADLNLIPHLLMPLAGPEEFDEEDTEELPLELQYLGEGKIRDVNPQIRKMIIESLHQLCATKSCRTILKKRGVYLILRELHKWEKDKTVLFACENLVDILISDEPIPELENLNEIEIPKDLIEKFEKLDHDLLNLSDD